MRSSPHANEKDHAVTDIEQVLAGGGFVGARAARAAKAKAQFEWIKVALYPTT